jgi:propionyl-CoA carboxylase alpha chain
LDSHFYFLEIDTRLPLEHPVTEWITGTDLVELQIGSEAVLSVNRRFKIKGHAVELRVYTKRSTNDFLPEVAVLGGVNTCG